MLQTLQLNFDDAFELQDRFQQELLKKNGVVIRFSPKTLELLESCRLFGSTKKVEALLDRLVAEITQHISSKPLLAFYGSGDYHHLTLALLEIAAQTFPGEFTLIHIDNHPDWVKDPVISCGSWINMALRKPYIARIISVGLCSKDLALPEIKRANLDALQSEKLIVLPINAKPTFVFKQYQNCASFDYKKHKIYWHTVSHLNGKQIFDLLNSYIKTGQVYITVDKDVLTATEQITNWDQGAMHTDTLIELLQSILKNKAVVGMDVLGDYSKGKYKGRTFTTIYKRFEKFMDQPKIRHTINEIARLNEKVNLRLLNTIGSNFASTQ